MVGDKVVLFSPPSEERKDMDYFANIRWYQFLKKELGGDGPFEINSIGLWPCGRVMLYLKLPRGREPGIYTSDVRCA